MEKKSETLISCPSHAPNWGPGLPPRPVPRQGVILLAPRLAFSPLSQASQGKVATSSSSFHEAAATLWGSSSKQSPPPAVESGVSLGGFPYELPFRLCSISSPFSVLKRAGALPMPAVWPAATETSGRVLASSGKTSGHSFQSDGRSYSPAITGSRRTQTPHRAAPREPRPHLSPGRRNPCLPEIRF